jgi:hypothetical protein
MAKSGKSGKTDKHEDLSSQEANDRPAYSLEPERSTISIGGGLEFLLMWAAAALVLFFVLGMAAPAAAGLALTVPVTFRAPQQLGRVVRYLADRKR